MEAAGLRRPVRPRAALGALTTFALAAGVVGCSPAVPTPSELSVSPPVSVPLDSTARAQSFRIELRLGTPGLAIGDVVEIQLFPSREPPLRSRVTLGGVPIDGRLVARPVARASVQVDEPGGLAAIEIEAISTLAAGETIELDLEVPRLPQQGHGLGGFAELAMPIRILREAGSTVETISTARWKLKPEPAAQLVLRLPSELEPGDETTLTVSLVSPEGYAAPVASEFPDVALPAGVEWIVPPRAFEVSDGGVQLARLRFLAPGIYRIEARVGDFRSTSNPVWVRKRKTVTASGDSDGALRVYWGDLHNHTRYSFDTRNRNLTAVSIGESLDFARRAARLDFIAITDHGPNGQSGSGFERPTAIDMSAADWQKYSDELASARVPGLVVFAGLEHLGVRGHTCLIFRDRGEYFIQNRRRLELPELWDRYPEGTLLSIPHLHPLKGLPLFGSGSPAETLVEMVSKWGVYEFYESPDPYPHRRRSDSEERAVHDRGERGPFVRDLLAAGKRYGFVGPSDHGPPGQYGVTAVLASAPTRDAIFDALLARRTWVTTGPRTWLDFRVGGARFGEIRALAPGDPLRSSRDVTLEVHAARPIEKIEILRNGEIWRSEEGAGRVDIEVQWRDATPVTALATARRFATTPSVEYYVRVTLADGQMAWGSPVFFELPEEAAP